MNKKFRRRLEGHTQQTGRIILVRLDAEPNKTMLVQRHMPTSNQQDGKVDKVYKDIDGLIKEIKDRG